MPYNTFTANTKTWNEAALGHYNLSTVVFGDPSNYVKLRPATLRKDGLLAIGLTRVVEKDYLVNGTDETRISSVFTGNLLTYPEGFTTTELNALVADSAAILTAVRIGEMLMGRY